MKQKRSQVTKALMTTMLLMATMLVIAPSASATDAGCGDPVIDPVSYGHCRYWDARDHCDGPSNGEACSFVIDDVGVEVVAHVVGVGQDGVKVVLEITGNGAQFVVDVVCGNPPTGCHSQVHISD